METYLTREKSQYNLNLGTILNGEKSQSSHIKVREKKKMSTITAIIIVQGRALNKRKKWGIKNLERVTFIAVQWLRLLSQWRGHGFDPWLGN